MEEKELKKAMRRIPLSAHGFDWRRKKRRKAKGGNQTPGNQKSDNCRASIFDKFCAKKSRSYKNLNYRNWEKGVIIL